MRLAQASALALFFLAATPVGSVAADPKSDVTAAYAAWDAAFNKGDALEITGVKVKFENVDTIFAREIKRGNDTFVFRDKEGRPIW